MVGNFEGGMGFFVLLGFTFYRFKGFAIIEMIAFLFGIFFFFIISTIFVFLMS